MEIKLKPCPFCGGEAEMMGDLYPYAECQKCAVNFSADHSYNFDFEDAAQKWNSRSTSDAQEITTLRQQLEQADARCAELEQTMYDGNVEREKCQRALILRAQADAVEEAGKEMLEEWPEFDIAHRWLMVQVESLRNQADEIENE